MLYIILKVYDCSVQVAFALIPNRQGLAATVVFSDNSNSAIRITSSQ